MTGWHMILLFSDLLAYDSFIFFKMKSVINHHNNFFSISIFFPQNLVLQTFLTFLK
jgi:hypothetical protein